MSEELITVGEITRHQGNKGEVRVRMLTDYPERFEVGLTLFLVAGRDQKEVEIEELRYHKGFIILKFVGFDDIEAAIEHKGYKVKLPATEAVDLPADTYFMEQIVGLKVYTEAEEYLGRITEIIETGANDVYRVKDDAEEILIPALKDVVKQVDFEAGRMIVELLAGLR